MLTVSYASADLGRTRFASSPLLHLFHGIYSQQSASLLQQRWWRDARRNVPSRAAALLELIDMVPNYVPASLMPEIDGGPTVARRSVELELEALREISQDSIAIDMAEAARSGRPAPRLLEVISQSGTSGMARLVDATRALFTACMAEDWPDLQRLVDQEIVSRGHQMATSGVTAAINSLHPLLAWTDDNLTFASEKNNDRPLTPAGRGFVLLPNLMTERFQGLIVDSRQPLLGYHLQPRQAVEVSGPSALGALIGAGRERALRAIGGGCGTAELAARLGIKPPAASAHAAALRAAGLVATMREGRSVRHVLTQLGADLLAANPR